MASGYCSVPEFVIESWHILADKIVRYNLTHWEQQSGTKKDPGL